MSCPIPLGLYAEEKGGLMAPEGFLSLWIDMRPLGAICFAANSRPLSQKPSPALFPLVKLRDPVHRVFIDNVVVLSP